MHRSLCCIPLLDANGRISNGERSYELPKEGRAEAPFSSAARNLRAVRQSRADNLQLGQRLLRFTKAALLRGSRTKEDAMRFIN